MALNIEKFKTLLADSDLPEEEQQELVDVFSRASDADLEPIVQLLSEDPKWIQIVADNYRDKKNAIRANDPAAWEQIIKNEEQVLVRFAAD